VDFEHLPSWASDYEFIICYRDVNKDELFKFYAVAEQGFHAEQLCSEIKSDTVETIIIHNVRIQGRRKK